MRHIAPFTAARVVALSGLFAGSAHAQGTVQSQHGDWQMSCDTVPGALDEQCALIQNVTAEDQPNVALSVIALKTADQEARLLRVLAPLGVLLPNGLGLNIDGEDLGRVAFVRCRTAGGPAGLGNKAKGKIALFRSGPGGRTNVPAKIRSTGARSGLQQGVTEAIPWHANCGVHREAGRRRYRWSGALRQYRSGSDPCR